MKNIPIYKKTDSVFTTKDEDFEITVFADFISQLLQEREELSIPEERLIIEKVEKEGTHILNKSEIDFLTKIIIHYVKRCGTCNVEIPLNEVFQLGGFCSYHSDMEDE